MKLKKYSPELIKRLAVITISVFFIFQFALAENSSITDLEKEIDKKEDKLEELEEKADAYRQIIEIKQKQQATLDNQVAIMEAEIQELEAKIEMNKKEIEGFNSQILGLESGIVEKEKTISSQKKVLTELVRSYYEYNQQGFAGAVIERSSISRFIGKEDELIQIGDRVKEILDNVKSLRDSLVSEKSSLEEDKNKLTGLYYDLEEKNSTLARSKEQKEILSIKTEGEESKYASLLARVEEQKKELLGDIDELYGANSSEINSIANSLEKPLTGLASTSWYYSQKDSRWGSSRIGQSNSLVKDYGCALTSVAMMYTFYGEKTTPGTLARQKIYYWDLIVWPNGKNVELVKNSGHGGLRWSEVDREIAKGNPVIVYVKAGSRGGHYVVIHHKNINGKYVVHDPYWGANIYLDSTMKLLSALYKVSITKNSIDQMILYQKK